jgi:hypothetical protein
MVKKGLGKFVEYYKKLTLPSFGWNCKCIKNRVSVEDAAVIRAITASSLMC